MDYKTAGVDIEAGNSFVNKIKDTVMSTHRPEVMGGFGGFNGAIKIPPQYKNPVLVSGTDGVGTKLSLAHIWDIHENVGKDLVAMCVNDVITSGAEPLYFLDYIATGKLDQDKLGQVVKGISNACIEAGCSLLGGETAEMNIMYTDLEYDLAGFCTGVVEEENLITGATITQGDVIIGIESNGLHSNGFTLINEMLWRHQLAYRDVSEIGDPTYIYAKVVREILNNFDRVKGMAHITGGGLVENIPRIIPKGLGARINYDAWPLPKIFYQIMMAGEISPEEMKRVFNLGIGYCLVVNPDDQEYVNDLIKACGFKSWTIGDIVV